MSNIGGEYRSHEPESRRVFATDEHRFSQTRKTFYPQMTQIFADLILSA
jgi:hypothetical protein